MTTSTKTSATKNEEARIQAYEDKGMTRSDAQAAVDAEDRFPPIQSKPCERCGRSFLDNSADPGKPDLYCSYECAFPGTVQNPDATDDPSFPTGE